MIKELRCTQCRLVGSTHCEFEAVPSLQTIFDDTDIVLNRRRFHRSTKSLGQKCAQQLLCILQWSFAIYGPVALPGVSFVLGTDFILFGANPIRLTSVIPFGIELYHRQVPEE